jgi:hypothetical protein
LRDRTTRLTGFGCVGSSREPTPQQSDPAIEKENLAISKGKVKRDHFTESTS